MHGYSRGLHEDVGVHMYLKFLFFRKVSGENEILLRIVSSSSL